jgi:hypothetical protein
MTGAERPTQSAIDQKYSHGCSRDRSNEHCGEQYGTRQGKQSKHDFPSQRVDLDARTADFSFFGVEGP